MRDEELPEYTLILETTNTWAVQTDAGVVGRITLREDGLFWSETSDERGVDDVHLMARNILRGWY